MHGIDTTDKWTAGHEEDGSSANNRENRNKQNKSNQRAQTSANTKIWNRSDPGFESWLLD